MAKFFRIRNKTLRWVSGLIVAIVKDVIMPVISEVLPILIVVVLLFGVFVLVGYGINNFLLDRSATLESSIGVGFLTVAAVIFVIAVVYESVALIKKLLVGAKKYGDEYFNSIND